MELDRNPITAAVFEGGYRWEERVVGTLLRGRARVAPGAGQALRDRTFDVPATLAALRVLRPGEFIYQPTLSAPPSFLSRYGLDPALVEFAPCRPDLIEYVAADEHGPARLRVIDVKASDALKASHRVQVTLYALLLREVLAAAKIPLPVDMGEASIWLFEQPAPEHFSLALTLGVVEDFLRDRVSGAPRPEGGRRVAPLLPLRVVRVLRALPRRGRRHGVGLAAALSLGRRPGTPSRGPLEGRRAHPHPHGVRPAPHRGRRGPHPR